MKIMSMGWKFYIDVFNARKVWNWSIFNEFVNRLVFRWAVFGIPVAFLSRQICRYFLFGNWLRFLNMIFSLLVKFYYKLTIRMRFYDSALFLVLSTPFRFLVNSQ